MEDTIDNQEYNHYWETNMFLQHQELDNWGGLEEAFSGYYDSSSPDGVTSSSVTDSKNVLSERIRRKRLNENLFALRAVVPNITKMDKASIIRDAIDYIKELHEQERNVKTEIIKLESSSTNKLNLMKSDHKTFDHGKFYDSRGSTRSFPIEVLELRVFCMGVKTMVVKLTCSKRADTMVKLCEVFESLKLNIISANITAFSDRVTKTVLVEEDDQEDKDQLKMRIQTAIAAHNDPGIRRCNLVSM